MFYDREAIITPVEQTTYLLIGTGVGSVCAAAAIRERDTEERLVMVGAETHMPYDRPPLTKGFLVRDDMVLDDITSKFDNFYPDNNIELWLGVEVIGLNLVEQVASLSDGRSVAFEKLLIATGSRAKTLGVPGAGLPHVHILRTHDDSLAIREALKAASNVVVVGGGAIGVEVATKANQAGKSVTVVEQGDHPWTRFASAELGKWIRDYAETQGVTVLCGDSAAEIGDGWVKTTSGKSLDADLVVVAVGAVLNTQLAGAAGLQLEGDAVWCDAMLRTSNSNVFVAGDVAAFPDAATGVRAHVEHHLSAKWTGAVAGANMAGGNETYDRVAYFWTDVFDLTVNFRGIPTFSGSMRRFGDPKQADFAELWADEGGSIVYGAAVGRDSKRVDALADRFEELIKQRFALAELTDDMLA